MEANTKIHEQVISYLKLNQEHFFLLSDALIKNDYFFNVREVDNDFVLLMVKRKKAMRHIIGYEDTIKKLLAYFSASEKPVKLCNFILQDKCYLVFFDNINVALIGYYHTPSFTISKVLELNKEYEEKKLGLIKYQVKSDFFPSD